MSGLQGLLDLHSHILPGADDGAENLPQSLRMARLLWQSGVRYLVATPHFLPGSGEAHRKRVSEAFHTLSGALQTELPELRLLLGGELYYYSGLVRDLDEGRAPSLCESRFLLVEFSVDVPRRELINGLRTLLLHGWRPILAHAERCACLRMEPAAFRELIDLGVKIQMNAGCLLERGLLYPYNRAALRLVNEGCAHFLASDCHDEKTRAPNLGEAARLLRKKASAAAPAILEQNPYEFLSRCAVLHSAIPTGESNRHEL